MHYEKPKIINLSSKEFGFGDVGEPCTQGSNAAGWCDPNGTNAGFACGGGNIADSPT